MKDLLRLLMVALLSFGIVGAALFYSRDTDALAQISTLLNPSGTPALDVPTPQLQAPVGAHTLWIPRPHQNVWMGIAGFPDQYDVRFPIPAGVAFTGGTLMLDFDAQLANQGDGRLTININGQRRGEVVLNTGRQTHKVEIALVGDDLLGSGITVEIVGRGTTNSGQICPVDAANSGSAITLLPSSGLTLTTNDPLDNIAVRMAALTEPMTLALGTSANEQTSAIWAAQLLVRAGIDLRLVDGDAPADLMFKLSGDEPVWIDAQDRIVFSGRAGMTELITARRAMMAASTFPPDWPIGVSQLGAEVVAKNFRGSRRWTIPYTLADLPMGRMPTVFDLQLKTSTLADGNDWVVRVSLNGNMLKTERFAGNLEEIQLPIDLPASAQSLRNALLIELIDTSPNDSICRTGPDAQAQLLPASSLIAAGSQPIDGWGELVRALARAETIGLASEVHLEVGQARQARAMLNAFLPLRSEIRFGADVETDAPQISITTGALLQSSLRMADRIGSATGEAKGLFLVLPGAEGTEPLLLRMGSPAARQAIAALGAGAIGLLIAR